MICKLSRKSEAYEFLDVRRGKSVKIRISRNTKSTLLRIQYAKREEPEFFGKTEYKCEILNFYCRRLLHTTALFVYDQTCFVLETVISDNLCFSGVHYYIVNHDVPSEPPPWWHHIKSSLVTIAASLRYVEYESSEKIPIKRICEFDRTEVHVKLIFYLGTHVRILVSYF